jgi:hypothetical protein
VWADEGERVIVTALDLLDNEHRDSHDAEGRQMRG